MGEPRGSIAFFATYRPPVPLDIFSCPISPSSEVSELHLTDGVSYNYNGRAIPPVALKALLTALGKKDPKLASECGATPDDVDKGNVTGLMFVSERDNGLETLHVALRFKDNKVKVLRLADIYGADKFGGVRMEDSGCFAGGFKAGALTVDPMLVYVSTKEPVKQRRKPWTVVYTTNLANGDTKALTPRGQYDLSPSVSPSGTMVAMATFRGATWTGEIEHLKTDIVIMNVQGPPGRNRHKIEDAGWPTWGSDNVIFFHRGIDMKPPAGPTVTTWGVFRYDLTTKQTVRVTPVEFDAVTPAAISETKVAVATVRKKSMGMDDGREVAQYRHIEIFDVNAPGTPVQVTQKTRPKADHYNPFVLDGGSSIGYHRARPDKLLANGSDVPRNFYKLHSPYPEVGLFRVSGVFPTISKDGSKMAFVDNEFKAVWLADSQGLRVVYEKKGPNSVFATVWNQNPDRDILYVCVGPSFTAAKPLEIYAIFDVSGSKGRPQQRRLTDGNFNNAFPSTNPEGTKLVFRSTRGGNKNLYIMQDADSGDFGEVTQLTNGEWTDTHCQWAPKGDWIVFSSSRGRPADPTNAEPAILDPGYFAVFLVKASDPTVVVRVIRSSVTIAGHVNHPTFSPDGRSIVVTSDLAAVSAEPISMPQFLHSVRPYGDIFVVDIDPDDINKNCDLKDFRRITHSRYEYSTPTWTTFATDDPNAKWNVLINKSSSSYSPACPYMYPDGGESWHMTGHLCIPRRCC